MVTSVRVRSWGVVSSVAAPVLLIGGWTLAARLQRGGFDAISGTISALAAQGADHRWVMTAALTGVGAAHVGTALALRPAGAASRVLLALGGVATALVAASPLPAAGGSAPVHAAAAGVAFGCLAVWPAISWRRTSRTPGPGASGAAPGEGQQVAWVLRPAVALAASAVLLAGLGWFFTELVQDGDRLGLSERVAAGGQALWPMAVVLLSRVRP